MAETKKTLFGIGKIKLLNSGDLKASVTLVFGGIFNISGIFIRESSNGLWVSYPSYKGHDGKYYRYVFPTKEAFDKKTHEKIDAAIIEEYKKKLAESGTPAVNADPGYELFG